MDESSHRLKSSWPSPDSFGGSSTPSRASDSLSTQVRQYYDAKLALHGASARGVDWSCTATQWLRFVQLLKLCCLEQPFSLIDLGCGYGALATFLAEHRPNAAVSYLGVDLSAAMIKRARRAHRRHPGARFVVGNAYPGQADYVVASGVMNVRLGHPVAVWEQFVETILRDMQRMCRRGFACNFMTAPTPGASAHQLYTCLPARWAGFCEDALQCGVQIIEDYGLREFTLLARRKPGLQTEVG